MEHSSRGSSPLYRSGEQPSWNIFQRNKIGGTAEVWTFLLEIGCKEKESFKFRDRSKEQTTGINEGHRRKDDRDFYYILQKDLFSVVKLPLASYTHACLNTKASISDWIHFYTLLSMLRIASLVIPNKGDTRVLEQNVVGESRRENMWRFLSPRTVDTRIDPIKWRQGLKTNKSNCRFWKNLTCDWLNLTDNPSQDLFG